MIPSNYIDVDADFMSFANRAAQRLVSKAPVPHLLREISVTITADGNSDGSVIMDVELFESFLAFRIEETGMVYHISPLSDRYVNNAVARENFVDLGLLPTYTGNRYFEVPKVFCGLGDYTLKALAKGSYEEISAMTDVLPFDNVGSMKLAMSAVFFEDKGESTSADEYWAKAILEETESAREYIGAAYPTIKFYGMVDAEGTKALI